MPPRAQPLTLPPAAQAPQDYDLKDLSAPVLTGFALRSFVSILESPLGDYLYPMIMWQSGITQVLHGPHIPEPPAFLPDLPMPDTSTPEPSCAVFKHASPEQAIAAVLSDGFLQPQQSCRPSPPWRASVRDYLREYQSGSITPAIAIGRLVAFLRASEARRPHSCAWLISWSEEDIVRQAQESTRRYQEGTARLLEGVPFVVKDVADALPYPTTAGTSFLAAHRPVTASAPAVEALQRMGAVLLGKSAMHEIGLGVTGLNLRTGTSLNPWGRKGTMHYTGGSSGGSAALVGAGVCPIAIGTDGGGSIRIPSSFCGCVGLKPTTGRVCGEGGVEIDCTVATYGPLGGSAEDAALLYAAMANQDLWPALAAEVPPPQLPRPLAAARASGGDGGDGALPLAGLKLGVFWPWFNSADPEVLASCRAAVDSAVAQGAVLVDVVVPELESLRVAHVVTIASEMHHCMQPYLDDPATRAAFNPDVRLSLMGARRWTGADYLTAQRIRARGCAHFRRALLDAHVLVTPTVPCTAPAISPAAYRSGTSNLSQVSKLMRFASQSNMTGLPAVSVPVGCDSQQLPIGLQFIGRPWTEATLLRLAGVVESATAQALKEQAPALWVNPLTGQSAGL